MLAERGPWCGRAGVLLVLASWFGCASSSATLPRLALEQRRGRIVLVDFFASGCSPCRQAVPLHGELALRFAGDVDVVIVSVDAELGPLVELAARTDAPLALVHDPAAARRFSVVAMPTLLLFDRGGRLRWRHEAFEPSDREDIERAIIALLRQGGVTPSLPKGPRLP